MGERWYCELHRSVRGWSSMVRDKNSLQQFACLHIVLTLRSVKGYLPYRFLDRWWRCQSSQNTNEELDLHYFLRGRRYLWRHYGHRLLFEVESRCR